MQAEVKTDSAFSNITDVVGEPQFYLHEVNEIRGSLPDGTANEARFAREWRFGKNDWKKIKDAKGDFAAIGIAIRKDEPVQGFDSYATGIRKQRVKIVPGVDNEKD